MTKKRRWLLLLILCLSTLSACTSRPVAIPPAQNTGHRANDAIVDDMPAGHFSVWLGGTRLALPLSLKELEALGFSVKSPDEPVLAGRAFTDPLGLTAQGGASAQALFFNPQAQMAPWTDCPLIAVIGAQGLTGKDGVTVGSTEKEIAAVYGDADEAFEEDGVYWMIYGTWLYHGLGFELDAKTRRVVSISVFSVPNPLDEEGVE